MTGLLLTISIIQEPASARPSRVFRDGGEWLWDTGRRQLDEWRVNSRQNRNRLEEWYLQDEKAHKKACKRGLESRGYQQDDMNLGTLSRSSKLTKYGCREVTDRLY